MIYQLTRTIVYVGIALVAICWAGASAGATPITFRFDAEIDAVFDTIPFDSGLQVAVGDKIVGTFTFDPTVDTGEQTLERVVPFLASIVVDGEILRTPESMRDLTLRSRDNNGVADFPPATVIDTISVGGSLGPADPESLPNVSLSRSSFRLDLWGDTSVLNEASLPEDPAVWNSFQFVRGIIVGVRGEPDETLGFNANVGHFAIVPEPATALLGILAITILVAIGLRRACP